MEIRQPTISSSRMDAILTETQDEDLNKPATIGTVRILAVHIDAGFTQLHSGLELVTQRIDGVETNLGQRIDGVEKNLTQRIEHVEDKLIQRTDNVETNLGQRIDNSVIELKAEMSVNMSTVMDQFALRSSSDRFIKVGFGVAVLGVLIQTAFAALK